MECRNGEKKGEQDVIPFYFSVPDESISQGDFARRFFTQFANHYYAYKTKNCEYIKFPMTFYEIETNIKDDIILRLFKQIKTLEEENEWAMMWHMASRAPSTIGRKTGEKIILKQWGQFFLLKQC